MGLDAQRAAPRTMAGLAHAPIALGMPAIERRADREEEASTCAKQLTEGL